MSDLKRWCSRYAAGTESYRSLVEWHGDPDEGTPYVLASEHDSEVGRLRAELAGARVERDEAFARTLRQTGKLAAMTIERDRLREGK